TPPQTPSAPAYLPEPPECWWTARLGRPRPHRHASAAGTRRSGSTAARAHHHRSPPASPPTTIPPLSCPCIGPIPPQPNPVSLRLFVSLSLCLFVSDLSPLNSAE